MTKIYSVKEVAEIFNVSIQTIYEWINKGLMKREEVFGKRRRISEEEVERIKKLRINLK